MEEKGDQEKPGKRHNRTVPTSSKVSGGNKRLKYTFREGSLFWYSVVIKRRRNLDSSRYFYRFLYSDEFSVDPHV